MSVAKKYKVLWGVFIIFIGLNVWLLYGKVNLQQQVHTLQAKAIQKGGAVSMIAQTVRFKPPKAAVHFPTQSLGLVALFTDYGCPHCAQAEIGHLNRWDKNFPNTMQVYYQGSSKGYLEKFGATFNYQHIKSAQELFTASLPIGNPIIAEVDKEGNVQAIHTNDTSRPGSGRRRVAFWGRMHSLFESVYGEQ